MERFAVKKVVSERTVALLTIIGHKVDYKGIGVLRGQQHIPSKN